MPGTTIRVGQVWALPTTRSRLDNEYHVIISIETPRSIFSPAKAAYASVVLGGKVVRQRAIFAHLNQRNQAMLHGWECVSNKGLKGLETFLKKASQKPKVYHKTKKKEHRDRLVAQVLTGTKPIA